MDELVYNIRLHSETFEMFHCDECDGHEFRQVTDILQGSMGYEVYECRCGAWYRCQTVEVLKIEDA